MNIKTICAAALAAGLSLAGASTASAHPEQFHEQFEEVDGFLTEICGFEIIANGDIRGTFRYDDKTGVHVTERGTIVLSANGKTLTRTWAVNFKGHGTETLNDDGTLTVSFDDRFAGMPERFIGDDGKTIAKDRGVALISGELIIDLGDLDDPFDDEVIDVSESMIVRGPHPLLESGLDPFAACGLLS